MHSPSSGNSTFGLHSLSSLLTFAPDCGSCPPTRTPDYSYADTNSQRYRYFALHSQAPAGRQSVSKMSAPSARALRKAQEIRHVRRAMRFYEHKKNKIAEEKALKTENTQYYVQTRTRKNRIRETAIEAARNARVDWKLGHLRPNRASGANREQYGGIPNDLAQVPEVPDHWVGSKDIQKLLPRTNIPDTVARNYSPFQPDDRVVVMKGKDKGKIGVVLRTTEKSNHLQIRDMNTVLVASNMFLGQDDNSDLREWSAPISIDDVRLVVPQTINGIRRDVIVEKLEIERHTSGLNLFTGNEEKDIPEAQQVDPETGETIWHRYISGTRTRIPWPWEETAQKKQDARENEGVDDSLLEGEKTKSLGTAEARNGGSLTISERIGRAVGLGKSRKSAETKTKSPETTAATDDVPEGTVFTKPRTQEPRVNVGDTTRNFIEDETYKSWMPSLRYEPFPSSILEEVAGPEWKRNKIDRDAEDFEQRLAEMRLEKTQIKAEKKSTVQAHIDTMKTPLEVKWELAQAAKAKQHDPRAPPQVPESLLSAIGQHIASKQPRK